MKKLTAIALTGAVFDLGILVVPPVAAQNPPTAAEPAPAQAGKLKGKIIRSGDGGMKTTPGACIPCLQKGIGAIEANIPAAAATDGAGKADVARSARNDWLKRNGGAETGIPAAKTNAPVTQKGREIRRSGVPAAPVAKAADGDGKADIAVFRPSSKE